jgi:hypothetical protein
MNINEHALGAARLALYCYYYDGTITNADIRHALEAAAPYLMAQAWDEGAEAGYQLAIRESPYSDYQAAENPYRSQL